MFKDLFSLFPHLIKERNSFWRRCMFMELLSSSKIVVEYLLEGYSRSFSEREGGCSNSW